MNRIVYIVCASICLLLNCSAKAGDDPVLTQKASVRIYTTQSDSASCTIPFNRVGNLIVVKAKVDSLEGNFVLDTGAPYLVLNITYFRDYPITVASDAEQTSITGQGTMQHKTSVGQLSFGLLNFYRTEADLVNLGSIENAKGIKVLGLLGVELFKQCEVLIDFEKSEIHLLRINKKQHPPASINFYLIHLNTAVILLN